MYVNGQMIRGAFQLAGLVARGAVAAAARNRAKRSEAEELTAMAGGGGMGGDEPGCGECAEEKRRMAEEAASWMQGLGGGR